MKIQVFLGQKARWSQKAFGQKFPEYGATVNFLVQI